MKQQRVLCGALLPPAGRAASSPSRSHRGSGAGAAYGITNCSSLVEALVAAQDHAGPELRRSSTKCASQSRSATISKQFGVSRDELLIRCYCICIISQQLAGSSNLGKSSCSLEYCVEITADSCEFVIAASVFSERFFRFLLCVVGRSRPLPFRPFRPVAASALV